VVNVGTLEMLTAVYAVMKQIASPVQVQLVNISRGVEQLETLRFESVNPTFLLMIRKATSEGSR
jgi:precorrin-6Y C5,15-methyltransferase (decarboxylating)